MKLKSLLGCVCLLAIISRVLPAQEEVPPMIQSLDSKDAQDPNSATAVELPSFKMMSTDSLEKFADSKVFKMQIERVYRRKILEIVRSKKLQDLLETVEYQQLRITKAATSHDKRIANLEAKFRKAYALLQSSEKNESDRSRYKEAGKQHSENVLRSFDILISEAEDTLLPQQVLLVRRLAIFQAIPKSFQNFDNDISLAFLIASASGASAETIDKLKESHASSLDELEKQIEVAEAKAIERMLNAFPARKRAFAKTVLLQSGGRER